MHKILFSSLKGDPLDMPPPEKKIAISGARAIAKYDIPGYRTQYQDMGMEEQLCKFGGLIDEEGALAKAESICKIRDEGQEVKFHYGEISLKVRIRSFNYEYYRSDRVRYEMELAILEDMELQKDDMPKATPAGASSSGLFGKLVPFTLYRVMQGDNLRGVMTRFFGQPHDWAHVARWNGLTGNNFGDRQQIMLPASKAALAKLKAQPTSNLPLVSGNFVSALLRKGE